MRRRRSPFARTPDWLLIGSTAVVAVAGVTLYTLAVHIPEQVAAYELEQTIPDEAESRFARAMWSADTKEEEVPPDDANEDAGGAGQRHRGEEGKMGKPAANNESGLYALKGPKSAIPQMSRNFDPGMAARQAGILGVAGQTSGHFLASPYGGAFAVGNDDAAWGGLPPWSARYAAGHDQYDKIDERPLQFVADQPLSTFSVDVDTASYSNVRRYLTDGTAPPPDAVRIEEMINYFDYAYPQPQGPDPFSVTTEVASCPWNPGRRLVRVGLQGRDLDVENTPPRNLVFLVDVSGSMAGADRLPLLQRGLTMLARDLRPIDRVAIVAYAGASGLVLPSTSDRDEIEAALDRLESGGSTNGGQGIELAYAVAQRNFVRGGVNRVIIGTDGDFNVGISNMADLQRLIETKRKSGVFLSVLGFGRGNLHDSTMEMLADHGDGNYAYIDSEREAEKVLVREAGSTLHAIAKDVKLQVEFNPAEVSAYRLLGYENRTLAARDFNDDQKDAGEIGSGHTVTALYEIVPAKAHAVAVDPLRDVDPLKYQVHRMLSAAAAVDELMTVKVRYKDPDGSASKLLTHAVPARARDWHEASTDFRFAIAVGMFGLHLRESALVAEFGLDRVEALAATSVGEDPFGDRAELVRLINRYRGLAPGA